MIHCSKPVIQKRPLLFRVVGCPPFEMVWTSLQVHAAGVVQAPREETAEPEAVWVRPNNGWTMGI